jgi:hypothetical protein
MLYQVIITQLEHSIIRRICRLHGREAVDAPQGLQIRVILRLLRLGRPAIIHKHC